ncbi:helix-turn-helix domain-containing protein [Lentzea xinjiangensis]|uniref:helix-turn-helix domain-containing protein n=1 Tax=Lentzea xinjiangensis TaxID=402600 RepID=UPI000B7F7CBC|nr:helix-turn-helix domain-containing protein [Lentzea xinjiangensis]
MTLVLFGSTLRALREDAGLTHQVLGERIHASNRTLSSARALGAIVFQLRRTTGDIDPLPGIGMPRSAQVERDGGPRA